MAFEDQTEHDRDQAPEECPYCHHSPVELDKPIEETHHEAGEDEDFVVRRIVGWYCPNCGRREKL
jgi:hypothetical protein